MQLNPNTNTRVLFPQGSSQCVPLTILGQACAFEPTAPARQTQPPLDTEQFRVKLLCGELCTAVHSARGRLRACTSAVMSAAVPQEQWSLPLSSLLSAAKLNGPPGYFVRFEFIELHAAAHEL